MLSVTRCRTAPMARLPWLCSHTSPRFVALNRLFSPRPASPCIDHVRSCESVHLYIEYVYASHACLTSTRMR